MEGLGYRERFVEQGDNNSVVGSAAGAQGKGCRKNQFSPTACVTIWEGKQLHESRSQSHINA